jgi:energy-coupling factor transporter ATP-binding protein EcfA2
MKLTIKDYGRIKSATIEIKPGVNLLAGYNRGGKSTLLHALAAVANPSVAATPAGILKKDSSRLVTDGAKSASITLDDVTIKFPANTATGDRNFLPPSRIALGLDEWTTMTKQDRVGVMRQLAPGVEVTVKDLLTHLDIKPGERHSSISSMSSVEAVFSLASQKVTERVGAWRYVTKANYGAKILMEWRPEGWMPEHDESINEKQVQTEHDNFLAELTAAQQSRFIHLKFASMVGGVVGVVEETTIDPKYDEQFALLVSSMEDEEDAFKLKCSLLDGQIRTASQLSQATVAAKDALTLAQSLLKQEKIRKPPVVQLCPYCDANLSIMGSTIVSAKEASFMGPRPEQISNIMKAGRNAREALDAATLAQKQFQSLNELEMQRAEAVTEHNKNKKAIVDQTLSVTDQKTAAKNIIDQAKYNRQWLKDNAPEGECPTEEQILALQKKIHETKDVIKKINQLSEANTIREAILFWTAVKEAAGDQGLRKTAMEKGLASINEQIRVVAENVFFDSTLEITIDGELLSDGRPSTLMSGAERKQANIVMQSIVASQEKSEIILIDEVGIIFDVISRLSLFETLAERFADKIVVVAIAGKAASIPASILDLCSNVFSVQGGVVSVHSTV